MSGATTSGYAKLTVTGVSPELKGLVNYYTGLCYTARGESWFRKAHRFFKAAKKEGIEIDSVVDRTTGFSVRPENQKAQLLSLYEIKNVTSRRSTDTLAQRVFENRKIDEAIALFQRSLEQDSTNEFAYIKLAECFQLKEKPDQALRVFRLATKKLPRNKYLESLLARQYVRVNDLPAALEIHYSLLKQKPADSNTRIELCLLLAMLNRKQEALDLLHTVEVKFTNHWKDLPWRIAFTKGEILYLSGDLEVATKYLEFAAGPGLLDPYVNYYYGSCLGDLEYLSDAKKYFYKAMEQGAVIDDRTMAKFQLVPK
jgi:tetratricopeptide (TPR) repeat protein